VGEPFFLGFVSNTTPWTFLGRRPVQTSPRAAFESGLDLFALRSLGTVATLRAVRQMLAAGGGPSAGRNVLILHDQAEITLTASRPVAFQVDGEYAGERDRVRFRSVPKALRVIA
jgi:diacylglycerol kinase family enzyme